MRYRTVMEQTVEAWDDGYGVVQIVTPESSQENQLRFCYYKNGEFVNRPVTLSPSREVAEKTVETVDTMASIARTFTADEIEVLIGELGEDRVMELSILIEELGKSRLMEILTEETE